MRLYETIKCLYSPNRLPPDMIKVKNSIKGTSDYICDICYGTGKVHWPMLITYDGPGLNGGNDEELYPCDTCGGSGMVKTVKKET